MNSSDLRVAIVTGASRGIGAVIAQRLAKDGITINAVAPGPLETGLFPDGKSDELVRATTAVNPSKRLGQPDDIANVVSFLAGPDAGWVNGQIIRANGGIV